MEQFLRSLLGQHVAPTYSPLLSKMPMQSSISQSSSAASASEGSEIHLIVKPPAYPATPSRTIKTTFAMREPAVLLMMIFKDRLGTWITWQISVFIRPSSMELIPITGETTGPPDCPEGQGHRKSLAGTDTRRSLRPSDSKTKPSMKRPASPFSSLRKRSG